jgi:hypothetical protein
MAQITPDGDKPRSIDDIVAALITLGIDVNAAHGQLTRSTYNPSSVANTFHQPKPTLPPRMKPTMATPLLPSPLSPPLKAQTVSWYFFKFSFKANKLIRLRCVASQEGSAAPAVATAPVDWADDQWDDDEPLRRTSAAAVRAGVAAGTGGTGASAAGASMPATATTAAAPAGAAAGTATLSGNGYTCCFCQGFNTVRPSESFYVVTIGLQVGVFFDWYVTCATSSL